MSERLRDQVAADDPAVAELARLLRAASEVDPAPGAQERVREALTEPRPRQSWLERPGLVLLVLAILVVVTPVVIAGVRKLVAPAPVRPPSRVGPVTAEATAPPRAPSSASKRAMPPGALPGVPTSAPIAPAESPPETLAAAEVPPPRPPPPSSRAPAPTARLGAPRLAPTPQASPPLRASPPGPPQPVAPALGDGAPAQPASPAPQPPPPPSASPLPTPEAALVLRALHLLRYDHDAPSALRELDRYRAGFPDGDLIEEVLALSIEAHAALNDGAATALAEQYLRQFPNGTYRALTERILREARDRDRR